ncbi:MAG TPA: dihydrofolate reductase family protein [Terriglobales bacterium]|nr:dihydrofolate reductase family protein [Terriglobales bacterium]
MRKIKIFEHISLDGVIQAPGGREEDGDYPYGGWTVPYRDPDAFKSVFAAHGKRFDLLLGRRTYDIWASYWPHAESSPLANSFNAATKFVATHRPESLAWGPSEPLGPDFVADIRRLKAQDGPDLVLWGSSTLTSPLLEHELADEIMLIVYPVLLGSGKRLFAANTPPRSLALVGTHAAASGIIVSTYAPAGPLRTGQVE